MIQKKGVNVCSWNTIKALKTTTKPRLVGLGLGLGSLVLMVLQVDTLPVVWDKLCSLSPLDWRLGVNMQSS